ncbi:MAG: hypothetical protein U5R48_10070 [Gammaproteobacteria bacterium]|nr:hypothetical protein [Gammaproteobacteria bacterium]
MLRLQLTAATRIRLRHAFVDASEPDGSGGSGPRDPGAPRTQRLRQHRSRLRPGLPANLPIDAVWNGSRDDRDFATFPARTVELDDFLLLGTALSWTLAPGVDLFVRGKNLLDERYEEVLGFRRPGHALHAGSRLRAR